MSVTLNTQLEELMFSSQIPDLDLTTSDDNEAVVSIVSGGAMVFSATHIPYPISPSTSPMSFACSTMCPRASPAFLAYGLLRSRLGIVRTSSALLSLLPQVTSRPLPVSCSCRTTTWAMAVMCSAPAKLQRTQRERPPSGGFFFAHWCRRNHTDQVPTKFDELYSRVAALIKTFGRQQPKVTEVSAETRKKAENAYRDKRFLQFFAYLGKRFWPFFAYWSK